MKYEIWLPRELKKEIDPMMIITLANANTMIAEIARVIIPRKGP